MTDLPPRVAAIDCGTNAIRLLVADVINSGGRPALIEVHREEQLVRLGEGVDATGMLAPQAIDRVWRALADYVAVIRAAGVLDVRMAATSAARDAGNAADFADMVRATLGRPPEVLTGRQEAEIGFAGTTADLPPMPGSVLVFDIGGGSTELVVGRPGSADDGSVLEAAVSLDVGAVRITERLLRSDPPSAAEIAAATDWVSGETSAALDRLPLRDVSLVVAVSGTALTVAAAALRHTDLDRFALHLAPVPVTEIDRATTLLLGATRAHRATLRYLAPGRVDVIGGGALILRVIVDQLRERTGIETVTVSQHDLLDGLALSLVTPGG